MYARITVEEPNNLFPNFERRIPSEEWCLFHNRDNSNLNVGFPRSHILTCTYGHAKFKQLLFHSYNNFYNTCQPILPCQILSFSNMNLTSMKHILVMLLLLLYILKILLNTNGTWLCFLHNNIAIE